VITIGEDRPSAAAIAVNAHALARYAALCQEAGLVPIVEPEVLMDGNHNIEVCAAVTEAVLGTVFAELRAQGVHLEGMLLKPNMVLPGKGAANQASIHDVAKATFHVFRRVVPAAVPGIVFLSGGQTPEQATAHLNAVNQESRHPWELSFSYGRALQEPVLQTWQGSPANMAAAQRSFYHRARCNSAARFGDYSDVMEASIS
jgi:fructose-bisphosphate aldolase class I